MDTQLARLSDLAWKKKVFHTKLDCSHLAQLRNVLRQPVFKNKTHITLPPGSMLKNRYSTKCILNSVMQLKLFRVLRTELINYYSNYRVIEIYT